MNQMLIQFLFLAGAAVTSGEAAAHKARMNDAQDLKADLKDALDAGATAKALGPAKKLVGLCREEEHYWTRAALSDAVELARKNLAEARQIASAVAGGRADEALAAYGKLETTCRACHDLHPEKRLPQTAR